MGASAEPDQRLSTHDPPDPQPRLGVTELPGRASRRGAAVIGLLLCTRPPWHSLWTSAITFIRQGCDLLDQWAAAPGWRLSTLSTDFVRLKIPSHVVRARLSPP